MHPSNTADYGGYQWNGCPTCSEDDPRNREVWIDTALSEQEGGHDLVANYYSHVHMFNINAPTQLSGYHVASPIVYYPNVP